MDDAAAIDVIAEQCLLLSNTAAALLYEMPENTPLALWGGVMQNSEVYRDTITALIHKRFPNIFIDLPPIPLRLVQFSCHERMLIEITDEILSNASLFKMTNEEKILVILLTLALLLGSVCTVHAASGLLLFSGFPLSKMSAGYDDGRNHCAIDIPAAGGSSVIASAAGQVTYVNSSCTHNYGKRYNCCNSIGRVIKIQHFDTINGSPVTTRYGHLSDIYVSVGDYVQAGQVIGTVGSTGYSTGNHLDFKMYAGDQVVDAGPFLQIPADLTYTGSDWANNGAYLTQLKSYNNTVYGGTAIISITTSGISVEPSTPAPTKNLHTTEL